MPESTRDATGWPLAAAVSSPSMQGRPGTKQLPGLLAFVATLLLAAPAPAAVTTIGSDLSSLPGPGEGVCALSSPAVAHSCTAAQSALVAGHLAKSGLTAPSAGTIVGWRVRSGSASPATASVKLHLRLLHANGTAGSASPSVVLPLAQPGIHSFPALLPVQAGDRLAVESVVRGTGSGPAYVPIAKVEAGLGSLDEWISPLFPGLDLTPDSTREGAELLVSAEIDTDLQPPRTKLTYPQRQDFLTEKEVLVRFRCNEDATVFASGQLEYPRGARGGVIYGLYGTSRQVKAGTKTTLRLRLPRKTLEAASRALDNGKRIVVKVTVSATDRVGNRSGSTVAAIRPKR
jgi:hypothetical protein